MQDRVAPPVRARHPPVLATSTAATVDADTRLQPRWTAGRTVRLYVPSEARAAPPALRAHTRREPTSLPAQEPLQWPLRANA